MTEPMSTAEATATPARAFPWLLIGWTAALLGLCYYPVLGRLVRDWYIDEDMGHGFFVPAVSAYIIWQARERLLARQYRPNYVGLAVVAAGGILLVLATYAVELTLMRGAFLLSVWGAVLTLGGVALLRELLFPLLLLCFMVPLPAVIYNQITFPLQLLASQVAEHALVLLGIPVFREGNILDLPSQRLSVVEACSGIRSLMSLTYLSLVYGHFFETRLGVRALLVVLTPPIAILVNALRVTITGLLSESNPELARGLFHSAEGWVMFLMALALMVAVHRLINWGVTRRGGQ